MVQNKVPIVLLLISLLLSQLALLAQDSVLTRLNTQIARTTDSLEKVYLLNEIANVLKISDIDKALYFNKKALKLANQIKSPDACGVTNELMGELFDLKNNIQPSINYYLISAKIYEGRDQPDKLSSIYGKLGMLYYRNNYDMEQALDYFRKSLDFAILGNNKELIGEAYNRIGSIFFDQANLVEAYQYFVKALDIFQLNDNQAGIAKAFNNLGEIHRLQNENRKAIEYYEKSLTINKGLNLPDRVATNYQNIGLIYGKQGEVQKSFDYFEKSLEIYNRTNNAEAKLLLQVLMGREYLISGMYEKAKKTLTEAYKQASYFGKWNHIRDAAEGLSEIYEATGQPAKALFYYKSYARYNDSINLKQKSDMAMELQSRFLNDIKDKEIKLKDNDILLLNKEKVINNLKLNLLIISVIAIVIITVIFLMRAGGKIRKERLVREKDALLHYTQQELMRIELKGKDNDLMNFALHLVQKNEVLKQLKSELKGISTTHDAEINRKVKDLSIHIQQNLQIQKEIDEFQTKVDQTYDEFFKKLKIRFPSLTKNEERLCALLRLELSTKEIATLNNISVKAVEMSRYRLRKKCGIENSEGLPKYLQNI